MASRSSAVAAHARQNSARAGRCLSAVALAHEDPVGVGGRSVYSLFRAVGLVRIAYDAVSLTILSGRAA